MDRFKKKITPGEVTPFFSGACTTVTSGPFPPPISSREGDWGWHEGDWAWHEGDWGLARGGLTLARGNLVYMVSIS